MQIEISGITIEVQKKNIKNLHLVVAPPDGKVRVSAPMHLSDDSIKMFVRTKLGWIKKQQEKFEKQPRQSEREYVSGETLYVLGQQYFLRVEYSYKGNSLVLLNGSGSSASSFCLYFSYSMSLGETIISCGLEGLFLCVRAVCRLGTQVLSL